MTNPAALMGLDETARFAPSLESVRQLLVSARAKVVGNPDRLALLWAIKDGEMRASHYATRLLCRMGGFPFLPQYLEDNCRTRREVLALLDKALRTFGAQHVGGWRVSSYPSPSQGVAR